MTDSVSSPTPMTSTQPLRSAVIGLGIAGLGFHIPLVLSLPNLFTLNYIVDVASSPHRPRGPDDASFAAKFGANAEFTSKYEHVLADQGIELVIIATPTSTHFDFAKAALEAGKHVLLDKPVTITYEEAKKLGKIALECKRIIYAFQNRRWDSDYLTVRKLLQDGVLGDITDFVSHYDRYRDFLKGTWKEQAVPGGGQFYSLGPHLIDQALHCFGRPSTVTGFIQKIRGIGDEKVDDDFTVILHYARTESNPTILTVTLRGHMLSLRRHQHRFTIRGSRGTFSKYGTDTQEEQMRTHGVAAFSLPDFAIESRDIWGTLEIVASPPSSSSSSTSGDDNGSDTGSKIGTSGGHGTGSIVALSIESERGRYQDLYKNLFASIREGAEPEIKWKEAELTMLITELAIQSSKEGRTVQVPPLDDGTDSSISKERTPGFKPSTASKRLSTGASISRRFGRTLLRGSFGRKVDATSA